MRPVLLVIDAQRGWLGMSEGLKRSVDEHVGNMCKAISIFRKAGAPIIFTYHSSDAKEIVPGTKEFELLPNIAFEAEDGILVKTYANAFNKTQLETMIRDRKCDTVLLIGLSAMHCVLATYHGAYDHDLIPYLVRGAVAGPDSESIQTAERICDTLSLRAIAQILEQDLRVVGMG
jgi:nicotinamidase-related amidase